MDALKICINTYGKSKIIYSDISSNYKLFLNKCEDEFANVETMYKYWIDDDGDKIEINGEHSYKMFIKLSPRKRIFIENEELPFSNTYDPFSHLPTPAYRPSTTDSGDKRKDAVHRGVSCDKCGMLPIIGFRYKCLECPDFDLCMICENKNFHDHHKMIRIPAPEPRRRNSANGGGSKRFNTADNFNDFAINIDIPMKQGNEKTDRSERRRKHHKRCSDVGGGSSNIHQIGTNVLTNLFQMMQGMAGNSTTPNNTTNISNQTDDNTKKNEKTFDNNKESASKEKSGSATPQTPPVQQEQQQSSKTNNGQTQYDPETIRAGAEVLNNFGKMFGKFLDPINIGVKVGVCPFGGTAAATTFTNTTTNTMDTPQTSTTTTTTVTTAENANKSTEKSNNENTNDTTNENISTDGIPNKSENEININLPEQKNTEAVVIEDVPEDVDVPKNINNWKSTDGAVGGLIDTEIIPIIEEKIIEKPSIIDTEIIPIIEEKIIEKPSIEKQKSQEDIGWTLIDNEKSINNNSIIGQPISQSPNDSMKSENNNTSKNESNSPQPKQTQFDYAQLSKTLERHILEEEEQRKKQSVATDLVYHTKPHINNAIIAMIAMGFSNEGKWLTHLLESVDGDISQALDLLKPVK